ncbi:hypothetical protein [Marinilactibacillus sp. Marseille-P9653]|uniref:hypothetical protein n=1 Tax=Marinilactibacillus sp. Marseille-P9653 TaxID=2866583 RepID=UPI001CE4118F|nr:hypothetical protein [Marinilactibacillus sp. Marseille-P9653]
MMPTRDNGYTNIVMLVATVVGAISGTIIGLFFGRMLLGTFIGGGLGYAVGTLIYFLKVKEDINKHK